MKQYEIIPLSEIIGQNDFNTLLQAKNPFIVHRIISDINNRMNGNEPMEEDTIPQVLSLTARRNPALISCSYFGLLAQKYALECLGVAREYANIAGINPLKLWFSKYLQWSQEIEVDPTFCVSTNGGTQGGFSALILGWNINKKPICFIGDTYQDFKEQAKRLSIPSEVIEPVEINSIDSKEKLEERLCRFGCIVWRRPDYEEGKELNEEKLKVICEIAQSQGTIIIEDRRYENLSPKIDYKKTIANYSEKVKYILLYSFSLAFNYPGERLGMIVLSKNLAEDNYQNLAESFDDESNVFKVLLFKLQAPQTSGAANSAQHFGAGATEALVRGSYISDEFEKKAKILEDYLSQQGFIVTNEGVTLLIRHPELECDKIRKMLLDHWIYTDPVIEGDKLRVSPLLLTWYNLTRLQLQEII